MPIRIHSGSRERFFFGWFVSIVFPPLSFCGGSIHAFPKARGYPPKRNDLPTLLSHNHTEKSKKNGMITQKLYKMIGLPNFLGQ
jgi:hypothetical protein